MLDLSVLQTLVIPLITILCLCVGYIIKNLIPNESINRFIPLIMGVLGIAAGLFSAFSTGETITLELIVTSLVSGLAATAVYEQFKNLMSGLSNSTENA